jgi:[pyruvate, water dikinase]-phosphate phosphotransferase / [pyruvate, water dikinase] kinase
MEAIEQPVVAIPPIFIISGGAGALGKHVARIALSQFTGPNPPMIVIPQVCSREQVAEAIAQVAAKRGIIIHTMVDPKIRQEIIQLAQEYQIMAIDTIGDALAELATVLEQAPLGQPGLYQGGNETYRERIKAIEYTVDHDDGRSSHELAQADVVLTGISRVGKTPLSIYLSVLGWRVANVPLVLDIQPPKELFTIDRRRVIGLTIDVEVLTQHRRWRQEAFGWNAGQAYSNTEALYTEIEFGKRLFRKGGFSVINVTNKPIEETADQVIAMINRYFEHLVMH